MGGNCTKKYFEAQVVNVDNNGDNVLEQALEQSTKILVLGFDCSAWGWRWILRVIVRVWMKSKTHCFS